MNRLALAAAEASRTSQLSQPIRMPVKRPKATRAYRYGPPVAVKREATSAKHSMMMPLKTAAATQAAGPAAPNWRVIREGRPKMPLPIMELTISAARLQRPILRTKPPRAGFALCTTGVVTQVSRKAYAKGRRRAEAREAMPVQRVQPGP